MNCSQYLIFTFFVYKFLVLMILSGGIIKKTVPELWDTEFFAYKSSLLQSGQRNVCIYSQGRY